MGNKKIYIFALAAAGQGISGSDRIFIEFARRWSKHSKVLIYVWEEGYRMCQRHHLDRSSLPRAKSRGISYLVSSMNPWKNFNFAINYLARIIEGIRLGFSLKMTNPKNAIIYSASEFWMDSLPAFILKLRYQNIKWVAAWFQTAPLPWKGFTEGDREEKHRLSVLTYWLVQIPIKPLVAKFADYVLVNNEIEKQQFPRHAKNDRAIVVLGAVDLKKIGNWKLKIGNLPKVYDAVFQGRFHPQKGVVELVEIWKLVVDQKSDAQLVMIGDGPLMKNVQLRIKNLKLENNITLKGFLFDGEEKYRIFSQSRIVVHPAFYDSGGMASLEAMAFKLPAVGFNLKSFESYYPQGMIKVKIGDQGFFAKTILELLNDKSKREKIGRNALNMINKNWSWDERAKEVLQVM